MRRVCYCMVVDPKIHTIPELVKAFPAKFPLTEGGSICIPTRVYEDLVGTQQPPYANVTNAVLNWYTHDPRHEGWRSRLAFDYERDLPSDLSIEEVGVFNDGIVGETGETMMTDFAVEIVPTLNLLVEQIRTLKDQPLWSLELKMGHPQINTVYLWSARDAFPPGVWSHAPIGPELIRLHNGFYHGALRANHRAVLIARYAPLPVPK